MPVPPNHHARHPHRRSLTLAIALLVALASPGCTRAPEAATLLEGRFDIAPDIHVVAARLSAAPADERARSATLGDADARATTQLHRDHWLLEIQLEAAPGAARAPQLQLTLTWNGLHAGTLALHDPHGQGGGARAVFDVGPTLPASSFYLIEGRWRDA